MLSVAKSIGGPGSLGFLLLGSVVGLFLLYVWPRHRLLGRTWLVTLLVTYLLLSLPVVATIIERALPGATTGDPSFPAQVDQLIVLDGDNADARAREAARLYARWSPATVHVLGSTDLLVGMAAAGVPRERIQIDSRDGSTREQMATVQRLAPAGQRPATALLVSRLQAPRIVELARNLGLQVAVVWSPVDAEPPTSGLWRVIPSPAALQVSRDALYEHLALAYYRWRGWI